LQQSVYFGEIVFGQSTSRRFQSKLRQDGAVARLLQVTACLEELLLRIQDVDVCPHTHIFAEQR
jgi:hypothetical protein